MLVFVDLRWRLKVALHPLVSQPGIVILLIVLHFYAASDFINLKLEFFFPLLFIPSISTKFSTKHYVS